MKRTMLALLAAWLLGIATALGGVAVTGGWYEYRPVSGFNDAARREVFSGNAGRWEPVPSTDNAWSRRPRFMLGW
jgi:hypothetical protein